MNLEQLRQKINLIDDQMMDLFKARMALSRAVGMYKMNQGLPILDEKREHEILSLRKQKLNDESLWPHYESFLKEIMRLSKEVQK
jgi:monofunctional chorismate mutase